MKEKTFEELFYDRIGNFDTEHHELIEKWEFIKFLQQVREATIEECLEVAIPYFDGDQAPVGLICEEINNLPTDRIKTEK